MIHKQWNTVLRRIFREYMTSTNNTPNCLTAGVYVYTVYPPVDGEEEVADWDHDWVPDGAARALRAAPALPLPLPLLTARPHPAVHAQLGQVQDQPGGVWGWDGCGGPKYLSLISEETRELKIIWRFPHPSPGNIPRRVGHQEHQHWKCDALILISANSPLHIGH